MNNKDCQESSWCCSSGHCVPGSTCYKGSKIVGDFCENNYECLSRCCQNDQCSKFIYCAQSCSFNAECSFSGCCSFGYCSSSNVCDGRKADGDICIKDSECLNSKCDLGTNDSKPSNSTTDISISLYQNNRKPIEYQGSMNYPYYLQGNGIGVCKEKNDQGLLDNNTIIGALFVLVGLVIVLLTIHYCICKQCFNSKDKK